ncbi:MAG: YfhO family protein [Bacilli bacterium]|nr:YfhO family protein [Bacilli bacterium]
MINKLYNKIIESKKNTIIFIFILALISSIPVFIFPGIKKGHDTYFHLSRICALSDNIKNLNFFSGIYPGYFNGYGYANGIFYPDIFLYFPALLKTIGIDTVTSYKIFLILINILSISSIYISIKGISKNKYASILGSIIYAFTSYRLVDMYERGALGETLAFIFIPIIIYGIYELLYRDYKKNYLLVIGMSGLILSHIVSTYMVCILLVILCLLNIKKLLKEKKRIIYILISALITLLITSYFIFPMLEQMTSGNFYYNNTSNNKDFVLASRTVPIYQLILEIPNLRNVLTNKYWIPSGIGIVFVYLIYSKIKHKNIKDKFINDSFILGIFFLFMTTSLFPWNLNVIKKTLYMIQFPWRFYLLTTILITIAGSILISKISESKKFLRNISFISLISLVSMIVISAIPPKILNVVEYDASYAEYLPIEVDRNYIKNRGEVITSNNKVEHTFTKKGTTMNIKFKNKGKETYLELPLIYYKGYEANINNDNLSVFKTQHGFVGINIDNIKSGSINISYKGTSLSKITKLVSMISIIIFTIYVKKVNYEK